MLGVTPLESGHQNRPLPRLWLGIGSCSHKQLCPTHNGLTFLCLCIVYHRSGKGHACAFGGGSLPKHGVPHPLSCCIHAYIRIMPANCRRPREGSGSPLLAHSWQAITKQQAGAGARKTGPQSTPASPPPHSRSTVQLDRTAATQPLRLKAPHGATTLPTRPAPPPPWAPTPTSPSPRAPVRRRQGNTRHW